MPDGGLIVARGLTYAALLLAGGLPIYLLSAGRGITVARRFWSWLVLLAVLAAIASCWWAVASVAAMAMTPVSALDRETVVAVLGATPLGTVLTVRLACLAILAAVALLPLGRARLALTAAAGAAALATIAWTGHAGATEGAFGTVHRVSDIAHAIAAAVWLGALVLLLACVWTSTEAHEAERRLAGFATTGSVIVAILVLTGIVNMVAIAGWPLPASLLSSRWGLLLGLKLAIFAAMLGFAALNRWRLTPALAASAPHANRNLRRSLALETAAGLAVVALVAMLGTLNPAA